TAEQPSDVAAATLRGLGLSGAPLVRVQQALAAGGTLSAQLAAATRRSAEARALREAGPLTPAWTHLSGDESLRARLDDVARHAGDPRRARRRGAPAARRAPRPGSGRRAGGAARRAAGRSDPRPRRRNRLREKLAFEPGTSPGGADGPGGRTRGGMTWGRNSS